ncbi:BTAD domain-containing putative transcriptional regulator [Streptomyces sp. NPDC051322]|uniref:AfsR/SARP family transcriptional regulator n=1 Tax=Streptomyces sp. NPDC051322 TaxID=3154645 RepID=UPI00344B03D8
MDFRILGPVEAWHGDDRVALSGSKVHTVLAALLLARGRVVSDSRLSSLLWGWDPPATANAQIYTYISRLRKHLGDEVEIVRQQPGYRFVTNSSRVDLHRFEAQAKEGRECLQRQQFERAGELLRSALDLWQGPALANVTEHLQDVELQPLEEARSRALENRIDADLALGRHEQIIAELTALVAEYPAHERLRAQLMTALYRCGRQSDALLAYHEGRKVLAEQLGVDPGAALDLTYQAVLGGELGQESPAPMASGRHPEIPAMLPPDIDDFIGRSAELATLASVIAPAGTRDSSRPRRILLTGMGGIGKTALAVHAAHAGAHHYPDGQLYVDLRGPDGVPREPRQVLVMLLRALGEPALSEGRPITDDLEELVRLYRTRTSGKRLLILLDNAVNERQLGPLLPGSADAAVVVTCHTQLTRVAGSYTLALPPLDDAEALALLASAAGRSRIAADRDAAADLVAYCAGLPLALRIAGARLASRPHWPAAWLARRLSDPWTRLAELTFRDLSMREVLLPSLRLLDGHARSMLAGLGGIGVGPFSVGWAAARFGVSETEAEIGLESLVDAALLEISGVDREGRLQYRCHELVRLYAATQGHPNTTPTVPPLRAHAAK